MVRWCVGTAAHDNAGAPDCRVARSTPFAYMPGRLSPRGELRRPRTRHKSHIDAAMRRTLARASLRRPTRPADGARMGARCLSAATPSMGRAFNGGEGRRSPSPRSARARGRSTRPRGLRYLRRRYAARKSSRGILASVQILRRAELLMVGFPPSAAALGQQGRAAATLAWNDVSAIETGCQIERRRLGVAKWSSVVTTGANASSRAARRSSYDSD
jgi:hypothetical protein